MISLAIFWFNLSFLVKFFIIALLFYVFVIIFIQLYSIVETKLFKMEAAKENKMLKKCGGEVDAFLDTVIHNDTYNMTQALEYANLADKNKYFLKMFIKKLTSKIRDYTDNQKDNTSKERYRILSFTKEFDFYQVVIDHHKTFGQYNTLSILGILRDQRALPFFKKAEALAFKRKSIILGYYVMLGYARLGDNESLNSVFDRIVTKLEVSSEHMYVGLLKSCENDVSTWQEDELFHGNINQRLIALLYFYETNVFKYIEFAKEELASLEKVDVLTTKEMDYKTELLNYCKKCEAQRGKGV